MHTWRTNPITFRTSGLLPFGGRLGSPHPTTARARPIWAAGTQAALSATIQKGRAYPVPFSAATGSRFQRGIWREYRGLTAGEVVGGKGGARALLERVVAHLQRVPDYFNEKSPDGVHDINPDDDQLNPCGKGGEGELTETDKRILAFFTEMAVREGRERPLGFLYAALEAGLSYDQIVLIFERIMETAREYGIAFSVLENLAALVAILARGGLSGDQIGSCLSGIVRENTTAAYDVYHFSEHFLAILRTLSGEQGLSLEFVEHCLALSGR